MLVLIDDPLGDKVFPDCGRVRWPNVGVMDPGCDAIYFESSGGCQYHDVGSLPVRLKGFSAVPFDVDPVSWPVLMRCRGRASFVDGTEAWPNVLMRLLEPSQGKKQVLVFKFSKKFSFKVGNVGGVLLNMIL